MSGSGRDEEFEALISERAALRRALPDPEKLEPPVELDRVVLTRARQAIRGTPEIEVFRNPRWALPAGLAATLILSLTIVLNLWRPPVAKRPEAPATTKELERTEADAPGAQRTDRAGANDTTGTPSAPQPAMAHREPASGMAKAKPEANEVRRETSAATSTENAAAARQAATPAASANVAAAGERLLAAPAPTMDARTGGMRAEVSAAAVARSDVPEPQAWLDRIARLRAAGNTREADREWKEFREHYPDYPVAPVPDSAK